MRRFLSQLLTLALLLSLAACGQTAAEAPTWQEQYDLGVKYLSEGNYEEAVIAFTAAIEIDPKRPDAFVGRGDAYVGTAQLSAGDTLSEESRAAYESAVADYLAAIELDKLLPAVYGKAADAYLALGDAEAAVAILERGAEATGDEGLLSRLEKLRDDAPGGQSETVSVEGYLIANVMEYQEQWIPYIRQYQKTEENIYCSIDTYGIRFPQPVEVSVGGETVTIAEAEAGNAEDFFDEAQLYFDMETLDTDAVSPMFGHTLRFTGYFYRSEQQETLRGPFERDGKTLYHYRPNGAYCFQITGWEEVG